MAAESPTPDVRASDADREDVADALRHHCAAGRLTVEELEERLAAAYAARTEGQLAKLVRDLPERSPRPVAAPQPSAPGRRPRVGPPGLRAFFQRHEFGAPKERVFADALRHVVPSMVAAGFALAAHVEPTLLVFETSERPAWVPAVCIFAFPFGLLALGVRHTSRIVMAFDDLPDGGTCVTVQGTARRPVRRAFGTLSD